MADFFNRQLLEAAKNGQLDELQKTLSSGADVNAFDQEGNTAVHLATIGGNIDMLRILERNSANFENCDNATGNNPLHYACQSQNKEIILFLLMQGVDSTKKNDDQKKPSDFLGGELKVFVNSLVGESKAFKALTSGDKQKLARIFNVNLFFGTFTIKDIDFDNSKCVDKEKSFKFNKFTEDSVNDNMADKDAKDFINSCAVCNKQTVNIDEWIFAFSKLKVVDQGAYEKFIEDYDKAVEGKGSFKTWQATN